MQKCWPMWFQVIHLFQKGTCFEKLTNITFSYLLSPTVLQHFKQILKQGCIISAQIAHFTQEIYSGKFDYYFCVPIVFYLTITFQKKYQRPNHQTRLHNFSPNWAWPCPPKGNFWEKLVNIASVFHILLCYIISKKSWESRS